MRSVNPFEIGLMFWAKNSAAETLTEVTGLGVFAGQLGCAGDFVLAGKAAEWRNAVSEHNFALVTAVCAYSGEDYTDIPTVKRTVGLVPEATRAERVRRTKDVAAFAAELGIDSVACHIGFVPHQPTDPLYQEIVALARDICDYCAGHHQNFTLETGQEPASVLLRFLADVGRPNLKINFDPANMILYGTGDPVEALRLLAAHIVSVHCKDGVWPPAADVKALGQERALGQGDVNFPKFLAALRDVGFRGILSLEREEPDPARRQADIRSGLQLLRELSAQL